LTIRKPLIARCLVGLASTLAAVSGATAAVPRPGSLDDGFGHGGRLTDQIGCVPLSVAGVERAEVGGGFLVVGSTERSAPDRTGESGRLIVRGYDRRGRLDRDVGRRGTALVPLPGGPAKAWGVTRQRDGKLVVVGSVGDDWPEPKQDLFVARFYPDGALDGEFGTGGVVSADLGGLSEAARDVVVQPDGRIVVAASVRYQPSAAYADPATDLVVLRYRSDGTPDPQFASGGVLRVPASSGGEYFVPEGVGLTTDGTILVGGNSGISSRDSNAVTVARVRGDGSLDTIVRFGGAALTDLSTMSFDSKRGRVYLAGSMRLRDSSSQNVMYVAAVRAHDLSLDRGFGTRGLARADFPRTPNDFAASVISDRRGRVVLAGGAAAPPPGPLFAPAQRSRFALARFTAAGKLDRRFGRRGLAQVRFPYRQSVAQALLEHPAGRLVVAGIGAGRDPLIRPPTGCVLAVTRLAGP
jgi:uncharacterized delta-60 repeat protein